MAPNSIGEQELALLQYIADSEGMTVGEVAESWGNDRGLARSTVLTMMERLRKKGHLVRKLDAKVFRYRAKASSSELLLGAVDRFVEGPLGGSLSPFVAYLSEAEALTDQELEELTELVKRLRSRRGGKS
jgi:predicted transcriptional regulator